MLQIIFICCLGAQIPISSFEEMASPPTRVESDEEAFLIRRIAEFWKDGDYQIVKMQIADFFDRYPESVLKEYFLGILGDIYLQEHEYEKALDHYQSIHSLENQNKVMVNKLHCYYELNRFGQLILEGKPLLAREIESLEGREKELHFLVAEGCFRQALKETDLDEKQSLAREARRYYQELGNTPYAEASAFALAEIYAVLGEHESGAKAYLELAELHPDSAEDLLFQAGTLQSHYDRQSAVETFEHIQRIGGNKSGHAAFNLIVLLFQNEDYEHIVTSHAQMAPSIPKSYRDLFNFIVGKSFFSTGNYAGAIPHLQSYINSKDGPGDYLQNALLTQMSCAYQTDNEELFKEVIEAFKSLFPGDAGTSKALFMHAMLLKKKGAIDLADAKLLEIKENYDDFEDRESFLFEYGLLAHQNERWEESYKTFKDYVEIYPESRHIGMAWKLLLSSSFHIHKNSTSENPNYVDIFFQDISKVLDHLELLNEEEVKDYSVLYAKTAYELKKYPEALRVLQDLVFTQFTEEKDAPILAEAHLIAGFCHVEMEKDYSAFCMHVEQAILIDPQVYDNANTHLQLYNAYVSLAEDDPKKQPGEKIDQKKDFIDHAAKHLQLAIEKGDIPIKEVNRLWLANYYLDIVQQYMEEHWNHNLSDRTEIAKASERAFEHYKQLLYSNGQLTDIDTNNLYLEHEALKMAKLMGYRGEKKEKLALVQNLIEQQSQHTALKWETQKQALFEMATVYRDLGDVERAYETFHFIRSSSDHVPSSIFNTAILESARLRFYLLDTTCKTDTNEEILEILNDLKELQIRKNVHSEPIHLEAALDYAKIRSEISESPERDARYLFLLKRIQDEFTSQEDLMNQEYLWKLNHNLIKKQIFDVYMQFIDAEKYRLEARQAYQQGHLSKVEELHESALSLYNEIKDNFNMPRTLYERILDRIEEVTASEAR